jgi:hypothetical protein
MGHLTTGEGMKRAIVSGVVIGALWVAALHPAFADNAAGVASPMPPATVQKDEVVITDTGDPVAKDCADTEAKMEEALHLTVLKVVVTKSPKWGTIRRAYRAFPPKVRQSPMKLLSVCWSASGTLQHLVLPGEDAVDPEQRP